MATKTYMVPKELAELAKLNFTLYTDKLVIITGEDATWFETKCAVLLPKIVTRSMFGTVRSIVDGALVVVFPFYLTDEFLDDAIHGDEKNEDSLYNRIKTKRFSERQLQYANTLDVFMKEFKAMSAYQRTLGEPCEVVEGEFVVLIPKSATIDALDGHMEDLKKLYSNLAKTVKSNIIVSVSSNRSDFCEQKFKDFMILNIHTYGYPEYVAFDTDDVFCLSSSCVHYQLPAKEKDSVFDRMFIDSVTNMMYAVKIKRRIDVLVFSNQYDLFQNVLNSLIHQWDKKIPDEKYYSDLYKAAKENTEKNIVKTCVKNSNNYIRQITDKIPQVVNDINEIQKDLNDKLRSYREMIQIVNVYEKSGMNEKIKAKIESDIKEIERLPQVKSIFLKDDYLYVYTNTFYVMDPRDKVFHDIGYFVIYINIGRVDFDSRQAIRIKNLKHKIVGMGGGRMDAPHVFNNGLPCYGNTITAISQHYKEMDLYLLVMDIIMFLESVNVDDAAGAFINRFPIKKEEPKDPEPDSVTEDELLTAIGGI
jgi:hypothetical protein